MSTTKISTTPKATKYQAALIDERLELDRQIDELTDQLNAVDTKLINSIGIGNSVEVADVAQFTAMVQTSYEIDFDNLNVVKPYWARKVTKKVFDRAKFNLLRKANEVPADVLELVEEKTSKPMLRITLRQPKS